MKQLAFTFVTTTAVLLMLACCNTSETGEEKEKLREENTPVLTAAESDPRVMGWMQGFPRPKTGHSILLMDRISRSPH